MHLDFIRIIYPILNYVVQILRKLVTRQLPLEMNADRTKLRINNGKQNFYFISAATMLHFDIHLAYLTLFSILH